MSDGERHFDAELQDALDDRLPMAERAALDAHLAACPRCRAQFEALAAAKSALAQLRTSDVPAELHARVQDALRQEAPPDQTTVTAPARTRAVSRWVPVVAAAAAVALVVWLGPYLQDRDAAPATVAADYKAHRDGRLPLEVRSSSASEIEAYFRRAGIGFPPRVFDLSMMQFTLEGGRVHRLGRVPSALFVYRGPDGRRLVCQMYPGRLVDLPAPTARRTHNTIEFLVYDEAGVTVIFWQEGDVVCVVAGDGDAEQVIQLAFAKAMKL